MKRENISEALSELDERMIEPVARLRSGIKQEQSGEKQEQSGEKQEQSGIKQEQGGESAAAASVPEADEREGELGLGTLSGEVERETDKEKGETEAVRGAGKGEGKRENRRNVGRGNRISRVRGLAAAACLCLLCIGAVATFRLFGEPQGDDPQAASGMTGNGSHMPGGAVVAPDEEPGEPERTQSAAMDDVPVDRGDALAETEDVPGDVADAAQEEYVMPESLFAEKTGDAVNDTEAMIYRIIPVGGYEALYEEVASAGNDVLSKSLGRKLEDEKGCYRLGGHDDLQYVISDNVQAGADVKGESYSLWEFQSFQTQGSYPYSDVLRLIYGLNSPDAIERVIVRPPTFDNTDEGMRIQKEIGTYEVTNRDAIETFYEVISGMVCYGSDHWELIDYGSPDVSADGEGAGAGVRQGRYLTLVTWQGCEIDRLKYTAVSDMFYEYSGVAYEPLEKEQAKQIEQVLGISAR